MKHILYIIFSISILFYGCKKNETEETQQQSEQQITKTEQTESPSLTARGVKGLNGVLSEVIAALKTKNTVVLNQYIDNETGLYYVISTQGIYSEIVKYTDFEVVFKESENTSEYEQNALTYLLDYLNNVEMDEMEIINEDLLGVEACDFTEKGFFKDKSESNSKILTDIYNMNLERDGLEIEPNELLSLGEVQNTADQRFLINDGEATYILYFTKKAEQYKLQIMDMRECSM
jgi:hypothetical protein